MDSFDLDRCERAQQARKSATEDREHDAEKGYSRLLSDMRKVHAVLQEKKWYVLEVHRKLLLERLTLEYQIQQINNELRSTWELSEELESESNLHLPIRKT